jgi:hypothetical protein
VECWCDRRRRKLMMMMMMILRGKVFTYEITIAGIVGGVVFFWGVLVGGGGVDPGESQVVDVKITDRSQLGRRALGCFYGRRSERVLGAPIIWRDAMSRSTVSRARYRMQYHAWDYEGPAAAYSACKAVRVIGSMLAVLILMPETCFREGGFGRLLISEQVVLIRATADGLDGTTWDGGLEHSCRVRSMHLHSHSKMSTPMPYLPDPATVGCGYAVCFMKWQSIDIQCCVILKFVSVRH